MRLLVINGVNMRMLGIREREFYGRKSYDDLIRLIKLHAKKRGVSVKCYQSDEEGKICTKIQKAYKKFDGIIINAGAYSHTSIAILDSLRAVQIPTVEVHISDITHREEFRKFTYISLYAQKTIVGEGVKGYLEAIDYFVEEESKCTKNS